MPNKPQKLVTYSKNCTQRQRNTKSSEDEAVRIRRSNRWKTYSRALRNQYPLCQYTGCQRHSAVVHHIYPVQERPDLSFVRDNTIPVCHLHHGELEGLKEHEVYDTWREKGGPYHF